jgi:uncharacterized protein with GYD domain
MMTIRDAWVGPNPLSCMLTSILELRYTAGAQSATIGAADPEGLMPLYIMLSSLSETGRQVLRKLPGSIRKVNAEVGRMGVRVIAQYAVLGPYDFVTVLEAPDNETVSRVSVELGARGSVQMMTMPAIPVDDFISRLAGPPRRGGSRRRR